MKTYSLARLVAGRVVPADVDFRIRGFPLAHVANREHLESRAGAFVAGAHAYAEDPNRPHATLAGIAPPIRGFAYEGAAMVATVVDVVPALGRGSHLRTLLAGPGYGYRHLIHVGVGWGLAALRLPSPRPLLALSPLLRWLALDGKGFHHCFFGPDETLRKLSSLGPTESNQVLVAGVGRALWFTQAAELARIGEDIDGAPERFRASMWSGVALASCYAGRAEPMTADELGTCAEPYIPAVRQGLTFAAAAIQEHGLGFSEAQAELLRTFDIDPGSPAQLAAECSSDLVTRTGPIDSYQTWRRRLSYPAGLIA